MTIVTLKNIFAGGIYNGLGFLLSDRLIFMIEAQSAWTVDILVRVLMYLAKNISGIFSRAGIEDDKMPDKI